MASDSLLEQTVQQISRGMKALETPFILFDRKKLIENCRRFRRAFPDTQIYFAVKANNHPEILQTFADEGLSFDVASWGEINLLQQLGISNARMAFNSPTKIPRDIKMAFNAGIDIFAFDSAIELQKLSRFAPGAKILARVAVDNMGSFYPLDGKFGLPSGETVELLIQAIDLGLVPWGCAFHVGSQNVDPYGWIRALEKIARIWVELEKNGVHLKVVDLGGGYPTWYLSSVPALEEIGEKVGVARKNLFSEDAEFWVEPGRRLVGDAGVMVTSVINRAKRGEKEWIYLDTGIYHGLTESAPHIGFEYPILTEKEGEKRRKFILTGPTCDSGDVLGNRIELPESLTLGDRLYILSAGAYTNAMETYNGIPFPRVIFTPD